MAEVRKMMSNKVTSINGHKLDIIDMDNTMPIYELTTLIPIMRAGMYPSLVDSLVERTDGISLALAKFKSPNLEKCIKQYGEVTDLVVPKRVILNNPQVKLAPLKLEYLNYVPFEENGVKFLMVSLIEFGKPKEAGTQESKEEAEQANSLVARYVYHYNQPNLRYCNSYVAALEAVMGNCLSN